MKKENDYSALLGKIGITESDIRPSGTASIDGEIYEVTADNGHIDTGRGVKVTRIKGKKIFVRRV